MRQAATTKELDHLAILQALERLPFSMGRNALVAVLAGDRTNETVQRNRLDKEPDFGSLSGYAKEEIEAILDRLAANGMVEKTGIDGSAYRKVYRITAKGKEELKNPQLHTRTVKADFHGDGPTAQERELMGAFGFFLAPFTEEQRHAIVCQAKNVLCVAGAGSGKTTVLTKRAEFLVRFQGVPRESVMAITFTRKARQEMEARLGGLIRVETFNSFCEKLLQQHGDHLYGRPVHVLRYADRMRLVHHAIRAQGKEPHDVVAAYFTPRQRHEQPKERLLSLLVADCFSILDHYANNGKELEDFGGTDATAQLIYRICKHIREEMRAEGLRDYSDQITDALRLLRENPRLIPRLTNLLVDEYQDVNEVQQELIRLLNPDRLFVVGDPRQSIFGWRGSRVRHILEFPTTHEDARTVVLRTNHRSGKRIVDLANAVIRRMDLPDLTVSRQLDGSVRITAFGSDEEEVAAIARRIEELDVPREEIFVLARTNRKLEELSRALGGKGIRHVMRSEDQARLVEADAGEVTLATVHAIKGMEARVVIVAGCDAQSFPCIATDRPIMDRIRTGEEPDRDEEELRLLYVALTRAKEELLITYSGTISKFLVSHANKLSGQQVLAHASRGDPMFERLRQWRTEVSRKKGVPPFMIFPDRALLELAAQRPADEDGLSRINGIGPVKVKQYGSDLLDILSGLR